MVDALIKNGTDVNVRNKFGLTPLHFAADNGHAPTALMLIRSGADINSEDNEHWTPLCRAISTSNLKIPS